MRAKLNGHIGVSPRLPGSTEQTGVGFVCLPNVTSRAIRVVTMTAMSSGSSPRSKTCVTGWEKSDFLGVFLCTVVGGVEESDQISDPDQLRVLCVTDHAIATLELRIC
jgi:hypothetical protein